MFGFYGLRSQIFVIHEKVYKKKKKKSGDNVSAGREDDKHIYTILV